MIAFMEKPEPYCLNCIGRCRGNGTGCPNYAEASITIRRAEPMRPFICLDIKRPAPKFDPRKTVTPRSPRPRR